MHILRAICKLDSAEQLVAVCVCHLQIDERMAVSERAVQALKGQVEVLSLDVARLSQGLTGAQALLQGHSGGLEVHMLNQCLHCILYTV
jgi:hypothetical protein